MKGLNLAGFKKLKSDAKTTTLQHPEGHKIMIARANLSSKMQKDLDALPFADGGKVEKPKYDKVEHCKCDHSEGDNPHCPKHSAKKMADGGQVNGSTPIKKENYKEQPSSKNPGKKRSGIRPVDLYPEIADKDIIKRKKFADGGAADDVAEAPEENAAAMQAGFTGKAAAPRQRQGTSTPLHSPTPDNPNDVKYRQSVADFNAKMGKPAYAEGGGPGYEDVDLDNQHSEAPLQVESVDPDSPEAQAPAQMDAPNMQAAPQQQEMPQAAMPEEPQGQAAMPASMPSQQAPMAPRQEMGPISPGNEVLQERNAWANDLANQHITPETYHSLFAKRDTLGKVGTLFGMLLGGIGAGLTHSENPVLQMMDKQIQNDLEAQKNSKSNAQNFLRINQAQQLQDAQIKNMVKQGKLTDAQANQITAETKLKTYLNTKMQMDVTAFHDLAQKVNGMPDGPQKQRAQTALGSMAQQIDSNHIQMADKVNAISGLYAGMTGVQGEKGGDDAFQAQNQAMRLSGDPTLTRVADQREERHIPGIQGQASRPIPEQTRNQIQAMNVLDNKGKDVLDFIKKHTGTWNPKTRAVAQQKIEEMKNFYNDSIKGGALTQGRLNWYDEQFAKTPTDIIAQMLGSTDKLKEMINSNSSRRDQELKNLGFPAKGADNKGSQPQYKIYNGIKYMRGPNGEAVRVK